MKLKMIWLAIILSWSVPALFQTSFAAVSAEEAEKLKTVLTPMGAERAGNADGTIPAWDGGYTTVPPGYVSGQVRPDPFADEKPLYTITAQNMDQYADKLTEGLKELMGQYPSFKVNVYPTHRTAAAPQFVYDGTFKNATRSKTANNGLTLEGAYCGAPFPIPKDAHEVMWNHLTSWKGAGRVIKGRAWIAPKGSEPVMVGESTEYDTFPYYFPDVTFEKWDGLFTLAYNEQTAPPFKAGELTLLHDPVDMYSNKRMAWQYLVGQRRVRRAPTIAFDTPNFVTSGFDNFDELFVFNGSMERYDWKLLGKKEMIVPYNCNGFIAQHEKDIVLPDHLNQDFMRYELHRVWVVEATLAAGKRHVVPKRRFYIDEDSWNAVMGDSWDAKGKLYKFISSIPLIVPELPAVVTPCQATYDFVKRGYATGYFYTADCVPEIYKVVPPYPREFYSPERMAGKGTR